MGDNICHDKAVCGPSTIHYNSELWCWYEFDAWGMGRGKTMNNILFILKFTFFSNSLTWCFFPFDIAYILFEVMELLTILESPFLFTKRTQAEHLTSGQMLVEWETVKIHLNSIEEHPRDPDNNLHRVCDVAKDILTNMEANTNNTEKADYRQYCFLQLMRRERIAAC